MARTRTKVLAILMSVVMAFSMISVGALAAFADDMEAQAGRDSGVVYDSVYGVLGGDYALMVKSVTYEGVYYGHPMEFTDTIQDIVRSDGTVVLHTSTASPVNEQAMNTGANTDFKLGGYNFDAGFLMVWSKSAGKAGLRSLEGDEIIPCAYDSFSNLGDAIVGLQYEGNKVIATFFSPSGANIGSLSYEAADPGEQGYRYTGISNYGNLVQFNTEVSTEDGYKSSQAFAEKSGSSYVQVKDIKSVISDSYGSELPVVIKTDGNVYVYDNGYKKIIKDDGYYSARVQGSFVRLTKNVTSASGSSGSSSGSSDMPVTQYFTLSGQQIGSDDDYVAAAMKTHIIMESWNGDQQVYTLYDAKGAKVKTLDLPGEPSATDDGAFFTVTVYDPDTEMYDVVAYKATGEVWKDLGVQVEYSWTTLVPQYTNGKVAGYSLGYGSDICFDLNLNKLDGPIADNASTNTMTDGTQVNASITPVYNQETGRNEGYKASVTDANGNAITRGGYTLDICVTTGGNFTGWNSVRRGDGDAWFAKDKNGKWGVIDSKGTVLVPFEYEGYFDANRPGTTTFLVKKNGQWYFYDFAAKAEKAQVPMIATVGVPEETQRLKGDNALGTMYEIVHEGCFEVDGTVVLAQFEGYWDALTAAGIAGLENAPVLMTFTNSLAPQTEALLKELKPTKIIVCGGDGSMPKATVDAAAKAAGTNPKIVRCSGDSAVDTAIDIYKKGEGWAESALIATVGTFQDALAAAPVAYANRWPIFLASYDWVKEEGTLSEATIKAMKDGGIKKVYIAGGEYWISKKVEKQLADAGIEFGGRMAGDNAMITSEAIAEFALTQGMSANGLGLATVNSYYDALCGAALCGRLNSVMLLVNDANSPSITSFIAKHADQIDGIWVFGGGGTISDATLVAVGKALKK